MYLQKLGQEGKNLTDEFVQTFLLNGTSHHIPTESLLLRADALRDLTSKINANKTYCFDTKPGPYGWCATCRVRMNKFDVKRDKNVGRC